jgi:O-methyltransferase
MLKKVIAQAKQLVNTLLQKSNITGKTYPPDFSPEDIAEIEAATPYTMTSPERIFSLRRSIEYITKHNVPGEIVECGVWKG